MSFCGYELVAEIGRGGMGVVYKARQVAPKRLVALKMLLHGRFSDPVFVERFRLEAEAAAHLEHPNIVPIYEVGEHEGQPYHTMKWIEGRGLDQLITDCRSRDQEWLRRSAALVASVARAVHYAHQRGVLHRDIKPQNILIDNQGQPYLTDFGLAKLLDQESGLTLPASVVGSPGFMAPEQAAGNGQVITAAADVYSLGAVLYILLTGKAVFQGDTPLETLRQVVEQEPARPRVWNPAVERDLETICLKCLQKNPAERYASADALAEDLERWLRAEPIQARRATQLERTWMWCRRQPVRASLAAALVAVFALGFSGVVWQWKSAKAGQLQARQNAYAADMNLAQIALEKGNLDGALDALNRQRPLPGEEDLRGWEWRYFWSRCHTNRSTSEEDPALPVRLPIPVWSGAFTFSPDGTQFIAIESNAVPSLWNVSPLRRVKALPFLGTNNLALRWSPDGRVLAIGDRAGTLRIWDYGTQRMITNYSTEGKHIGALKFQGGGRTLMCGLVAGPPLRARSGRFFDVQTWREIPLPSDWPASKLRWGAVSSDNKVMAAIDNEGTVAWWDMASGRKRVEFKRHFGKGGYLSFSPVSRLLAGSSEDGHTAIWDTATFRIVTTNRANFRTVFGVSFSGDGQRVLSGGEEATDVVRLLDLGSLRHVASLAGPSDRYFFVELAPDGNTLAAAGIKGTTILYRAPSWAEIEAAESGNR